MTTAPPARRLLMCPPEHFEVSYEINPWMDVRRAVDRDRAMAQWATLRDTYLDLGHTVDLIDPVPGLPDMVYAANGATVLDGVGYTARFRHPERAAEAPAYEKWLADHGFETQRATCVNEGEGDLLVAGPVVLAGTGFRTDRAAHAEAEALFRRPVLTLELVDPRFYHLDTALTVLTGGDGVADDARAAGAHVAYFPPAFSPASQELLAARYPDAILAPESDALALGLNAVSDGLHVVVAPAADHLAGALREHGYEPIPVDTSELLKGGGGAKCCTLEIRETR